MENRLFKVYFCYRPDIIHTKLTKGFGLSPKEFVCITTADRIAKISEHYSELWGLIIDPCHTNDKNEYYSAEELTESKILQEWEGFDVDALLVCVKTGEKFWYKTTRDRNGVDGYQLEPISGNHNAYIKKQNERLERRKAHADD